MRFDYALNYGLRLEKKKGWIGIGSIVAGGPGGASRPLRCDPVNGRARIVWCYGELHRFRLGQHIVHERCECALRERRIAT